MTQTEIPKATVSVLQAGRTIGYGKNSTYQLIKDGRLKVVRVGRKMRVPVAEIEAFLRRETEGDQ